MDKTNILYDHYKDTFLLQKDNEKIETNYLLLCVFVY